MLVKTILSNMYVLIVLTTVIIAYSGKIKGFCPDLVVLETLFDSNVSIYE